MPLFLEKMILFIVFSFSGRFLRLNSEISDSNNLYLILQNGTFQRFRGRGLQKFFLGTSPQAPNFSRLLFLINAECLWLEFPNNC